MGLQETKIESLPFVTAELNYLAPVAGKPRTYAFDPPPGEPKSTALPEAHNVPIFDGRLIADSFSLDREGFAVVRQRSAVGDFYNEDEVKKVYYPEAERLIKAVTNEFNTPSQPSTGAKKGNRLPLDAIAKAMVDDTPE